MPSTGQPALVFGDDGVSSYPATILTGQSVTDSGGTRYDYPAGDYRFPLVRPGRYRLIVEPPEPLYGAVGCDAGRSGASAAA